jgi:hypothetical protein
LNTQEEGGWAASSPSLRHGAFFAAPCLLNHEVAAALCVDTLHRAHVFSQLSPNQLRLVRL